MLCLKLLIAATNLGSESKISVTDSAIDIRMHGPDHLSREDPLIAQVTCRQPPDVNTSMDPSEITGSGAQPSWSSPHLATEQDGTKRSSHFNLSQDTFKGNICSRPLRRIG